MATSAHPDLSEIVRDGRWLAHRYDEAADEIQFRLVDRERHREVTFLTDQAVADLPMVAASRAACLVEAQTLNLDTPRFILHSAYCCSTLLARAFDLPGKAMGLKEPLILNDVVGLQMRGGDPRQVAAALDAACSLLARPLQSGELAVIKPSNVFNPMLPLLMALRPRSRLLLLYAPLESFLGSIARKDVEGRAWVRELMWKLIRLGQLSRFGFTEEELYRHTDLQVAALGWLVQHAAFGDLTAAHPGNVRSLSSEVLMADPSIALKRLGSHFGISFDAEQIAAGPAFTRHSKDGSNYSAADRSADRSRGLEAHSGEIALVMEWSRKVAEHAGIAFDLPNPLTDDGKDDR